jgi:hypothetical protein
MSQQALFREIFDFYFKAHEVPARWCWYGSWR